MSARRVVRAAERWSRWLATAVRVAGWAPLAVFSAHVLASRLLGTYRVFPSLDVPMHLVGGAAIGYFFWRSLGIRESRPVIGALTITTASLLSLAATGTTTVFWEFAEWLSDRYLGTHAQDGLNDTMLDMLLGFVGGLALLTVASTHAYRELPQPTPAETLGNRNPS